MIRNTRIASAAIVMIAGLGLAALGVGCAEAE